MLSACDSAVRVLRQLLVTTMCCVSAPPQHLAGHMEALPLWPLTVGKVPPIKLLVNVH